MRARMKRRQRMRTLTILSVVAVLIVIVVIAAYLYSTSNGGSDLIGKQVSSAVYGPLYQIAQTPTSYSHTNTTLLNKVQTYNGSPFTSGGKPIILYIGADYCPYCSFQRWALVMSLMRFGNFSSLRYMQSSSTDVFPNSATFTFDGSKYSSNYVVFQPYEQADRSGNPLQTVPSNYTAVFSHFGAGYPFIDVANKYVVASSFFFPDRLVGLNWTQIVGFMSSNTQIAAQIESSANVLTALICHVTNGNPGSVCSNPSITALSTNLTAFHPASSAILMAGSPSSMAKTWANVQYGQMAWRTKSSTEIR